MRRASAGNPIRERGGGASATRVGGERGPCGHGGDGANLDEPRPLQRPLTGKNRALFTSCRA
jgi:hypothetical protein